MKVCKRGHVITSSNSMFYASGRYKGEYKCCRDCKRFLDNKWRLENIDKIKKYRMKAKDHISKYNKQYVLDNPEKERRRGIKRRHGITPEEYDLIFLNQGNKCANSKCKTALGSKNRHLDHCHVTGQIRGGLCSKCNMALGLLKDDLETIKGLFDYLSNYK